MNQIENLSVDLKSKLTDIAREVVREQGIDALNLRLVASRGETSTQAIYTLFGGKSGLIQAMYQRWVIDLEQRLLASPASLPDELMVKTAEIYREQALSDPELFMAGTTSVAIEADVLGMMYRSQAFAVFVGFLKKGLDSGFFQPLSDSQATAKAIWSAVHGMVLFELCDRSHDKRNALNELIPILVRGLKAL